MATYDWQWYNGSVWTSTGFQLLAVDNLGFFDTTYGSFVQLMSYNKSMHIVDSVPSDKCPYPHLCNLEYFDTDRVSIDGAGATALSGVANENCMRIAFNYDGTPRTTNGGKLYVYDGLDIHSFPAGVSIKTFEKGNTVWKSIGSADDPLVLADHTLPAIVHYFYIGISCSPVTAGAHIDLKFRFEINAT